MAKIAVDASCMVVPIICNWHPHHALTTEELARLVDGGDSIVVPAPAAVETYSVVTRLPTPHRLSPADAARLIEANFLDGVELATLSSGEYANSLRIAAQMRIAGGAVYDAIIAACARSAGATVLLTFNERHFAPFAGADLAVRVPARD